MEFNVDSKSFLDALKTIEGFTPKTGDNSVLYNILISCDKEMTITGSSQTCGAIVDVESDIIDTGKCLLLLSDIMSIVKEMKGENIHFKMDDSSMIITGDGSNYNLPTIDTENYPEIDFESELKFTISSDTLIDCIKKTAFCVATEMTRFTLGGIKVVRSDKSVDFVGTDGRRMGIMTLEQSGEDLDVILAPSGMKSLRGVLEACETCNVDFYSDDHKAVFKISGVSVRVSLMAGNFPDYTKVIPDTCEYTFNIDRLVIDRMIRMTALTTDADSRSVVFTITKNKFKTSCKTTRGESKIEQDIEYDGDELKFKLNPIYVRDGLRAVGGEVVDVSFKNSKGPLILTGNGEYRYMVSTMTL